jgi:SAM-dependent methyltransferase
MNLKFLAFKYRYAPLFYLRKHEEALQNALIIPYDSEEENSPYLRFGDRYKAVESKTSQKSSYKIFAPTPLLAAREIFKAIKLSKKDSLLDIGCGTGNFNYFAYLYEPKLSQNHGIDINLDLINIGKNYFNQKNVDEKINLFQKDFFKISLPKKSNHLQGLNKLVFL